MRACSCSRASFVWLGFLDSCSGAVFVFGGVYFYTPLRPAPASLTVQTPGGILVARLALSLSLFLLVLVFSASVTRNRPGHFVN